MTAATRLVSVNVTYLRADWSHRFDPKETRPGKFFAFGEKSVLLVPTMSHNEDCRYVALNRDGSIFPTPDKVPAGSNDADISFYPKEGGYHVIERPYAGQRASMVMILPTRFQRLTELEAALTPAQLEVILRGQGALLRGADAEIQDSHRRFALGAVGLDGGNRFVER